MHTFNSNYVQYNGVTDVQIYKIHYFLIQQNIFEPCVRKFFTNN